MAEAREQHSYTDRHLAYCWSVLDGSIPACRWTKAAAQRQIDDLERWKTDGEYYFDIAVVDRVCSFVESLPHIKGEWARQKLTLILQDWQIFILACVFGWRRRLDGTRRFRMAYTEVARKNGKSALLAAVALYLFAADGEAGAEVYSLATTHDQAAIVAGVAKQMALKDQEFREAFGIEVRAHFLWIDSSASTLRAMSADGGVLDGLNVHGGIIDELHAHKTREVWDVIETATGSRQQPLVWAITTAGSNRAGICYEQRGYVCKILNSTLKAHGGLGYEVKGDAAVDETYFGAIYTIDDEDEWTDENAWIKANPNLGVSVKWDDMRRLARKAMQTASAVPNFLTKRLNVWVNADSAWMDMRAWDRQADRQMAMEDFRDWEAYIGLDLASKLDITAMVAVLRKGNQYRLFGRYYLPEDAIESSSNSQYQGWAATEAIIETGGNCVDYSVIEADLKDWCGKLNVREVAFDPGFAWDFCQRMNSEGLPMVEVRATVMNYSEPMKELEAAILNGRLTHDGNPAMTWMVSNVVCHRDAKDNIYPRKESEANKIDGPVAAMAALGRALAAQPVSTFGFDL